MLVETTRDRVVLRVGYALAGASAALLRAATVVARGAAGPAHGDGDSGDGGTVAVLEARAVRRGGGVAAERVLFNLI